MSVLPTWHDFQGIQEALTASGASDLLGELSACSDALDEVLIMPTQQYRAVLRRFAEAKQRAYIAVGGQPPRSFVELLKRWGVEGNT